MDKCVSKCDLGNYSIGKQRKHRRVMATNIHKVRMTMKTQKKKLENFKARGYVSECFKGAYAYIRYVPKFHFLIFDL